MTYKLSCVFRVLKYMVHDTLYTIHDTQRFRVLKVKLYIAEY